ncbi:MAG TPA: hypothetical protein VFU63_00055 [Ktedonobacterales bacterium]|nr:hypothetical protein [Ktedonobacterales bacterium]
MSHDATRDTIGIGTGKKGRPSALDGVPGSPEARSVPLLAM